MQITAGKLTKKPMSLIVPIIVIVIAAVPGNSVLAAQQHQKPAGNLDASFRSDLFPSSTLATVGHRWTSIVSVTVTVRGKQ